MDAEAPIDKLPMDVLWLIFFFLSTRTLLYCKRVCRKWKKGICDPEFAIQRQQQGCYTSILIQGSFGRSDMTDLYLLDLHKNSNLCDDQGELLVPDYAKIVWNPTPPFNLSNQPFKVRNLPFKLRDLMFINECNGLVCMMMIDVKRSPFIIVNFLTSEWWIINQPLVPKSYTIDSCGLGFSPESGQFKVIRIMRHKWNQDIAQLCKVGTNTWEDVDGFVPDFEERKIFFRNSLYWWNSNGNPIWGFNFDNGKFFKVELLEEMKRLRVDGLTVLNNNCLCCLTRAVMRGPWEFWIREDDDWVKHDSWKTKAIDKVYEFGMLPYLELGTSELLVWSSGYRDNNINLFDQNSGKLRSVYFRKTFVGLPCNTRFSKLQ